MTYKRVNLETLHSMREERGDIAVLGSRFLVDQLRMFQFDVTTPTIPPENGENEMQRLAIVEDAYVASPTDFYLQLKANVRGTALVNFAVRGCEARVVEQQIRSFLNIHDSMLEHMLTPMPLAVEGMVTRVEGIRYQIKPEKLYLGKLEIKV